MKRQLLSLLLILSFYLLSGQEYTGGLSYDSIEAQSIKLQEYLDDDRDSTALLLAEQLISFWVGKLELSDSRSAHSNYYNLLVTRNELLNKLDKIYADDINRVVAIESEIKNQLPTNKNLLARHYYIVAQIHKKVSKDKKLTIDYLEKSLALYEEFESNNIVNRVELMNALGKEHRMTRAFSDGREYFESSLELNPKQTIKDSILLVDAHYGLAAICYYTSKNDEGLSQSITAKNLAEKLFEKGDNRLMKIYRQLGIMYSTRGELRQSLKYALISLDGMKDESGKAKKGIAGYYSAVSSTYDNLGETSLGLAYVDSAIVYSIRDKELTQLAYCYHDKALLLQNSDEFVDLVKKSIEICEAQENFPVAAHSIMLQNLGDHYVTNGNLSQGLVYVTKAQNLKESNYEHLGRFLPSTYGSLAMINEYSGDLPSAIKYQQRALKTVLEFRPRRSHFVAVEMARLGKYLMGNDELAEAQILLEEAHEIFEEKVIRNNFYASMATRSLGELFSIKQNTKQALHFAHLSLSAVEGARRSTVNQLKLLFEIHHTANQKDSCQYYLKKLLVDSRKGSSVLQTTAADYRIVNKWDAFSSYYQYLILEEKLLGSEQTEILQKIKEGIKLIDEIRPSNFFEVAESDFQKQTRKFFDWSINKLHDNYTNTKDEELLSLIFDCIEKSKSIIINRDFVRKDFLWEGKIPEELLMQEKRILQDFNTAYEKFQKAEEGNSLKSDLTDNMFDLEIERVEFLDRLKSDFPEYYKNRYEQKLCSYDQLKGLAREKKKAILVYYWSESKVHRLMVTPSGFDYHTVQTDSIKNEIETISVSLGLDGKTIQENNYGENKFNFANSAIKLYDYLFENLNEQHLTEELIIIPDGDFIKFPFEILLTKKPNTNDSYKDFPYLIHDCAVSYMGSATQLLNSISRPSNENKKQYLGFGPRYKSDNQTETTFEMGLRYSDEPLLYNVEEIRNSALLFDGDSYLSEKATKGQFLKTATEYKILHLAMHASVNDNYPMESYLNFTSTDTVSSTSQLYVHEIAKLNLNTDLVVLSACATNSGSQDSGDGILGIAKAFKLASCDNLILSNWLVDDRSSSKIISTFFRKLSEDQIPSQALRTAKLEFLNQSSIINSHPKYWAAFSYYGNPYNSISLDSSSIFGTYSFVGFLLIFLLLSTLVWKVRNY